ncbi:60S ribosomal protein L33B [Dimargaris cristalligena]|nr:60S ribosomal protein L33B [Dimargaris cristalligena]
MAQPTRLHTRGRILGYKRSKHSQHPNVSLIQLENVATKAETDFYLGKRVAYIYKGSKKNSNGSKVRVIWGRIARPHGNSGVVRARFTTNLPPCSFGSMVRVMMYPSRV